MISHLGSGHLLGSSVSLWSVSWTVWKLNILQHKSRNSRSPFPHAWQTSYRYLEWFPTTCTCDHTVCSIGCNILVCSLYMFSWPVILFSWWWNDFLCFVLYENCQFWRLFSLHSVLAEMVLSWVQWGVLREPGRFLRKDMKIIIFGSYCIHSFLLVNL
jgi:hypothetical protein